MIVGNKVDENRWPRLVSVECGQEVSYIACCSETPPYMQGQ